MLTKEHLYIIGYILIWIVTLLIYQKKRRFCDAGSILLMLSVLYSILSLLVYNNNDINHIQFNHAFDNIKIFPFILLYVLWILTMAPIMKFDTRKVYKIETPQLRWINIIAIIFIIATMLRAVVVIPNLQTSIYSMMTDVSIGQDLYQDGLESVKSTGSGISDLPAIISGAFSGVGIFLTFFYLTLSNRNKIIQNGLILSCLVLFVVSISMGQRGDLIETMLVVICTYFFMKKFISNKINNRVKKIGIVIVVILSVPFILLTLGRFEKIEGGVFSSISYYAGQQNLVFNEYALDNNGIRNGDRTIPLFKRMIGYSNVPKNFFERRQKYKELKINDEIFISHVGDFLLDYGPVLGSIIIVLLSLLLLSKTKIVNNKVKFHQLILLHIVIYMCAIGGLKLFPFSDTGGNLKLIVYIIVYMFFRINDDFTYKKIKK